MQSQEEERKEETLQEKEVVNSSSKNVAEILSHCESMIAKKYKSNFREFSRWVKNHRAIEKKLSRFDNLEEILTKIFVKKVSVSSLSKVPNMEKFLKLFSKKEIRYVFPTNDLVDNWWVL